MEPMITYYRYQNINIIQMINYKLHVLTMANNNFLPWLDEREREMQQTIDLTSRNRQRLMISKETLLGLRMTGI
jgi:hypothetical protein